MTRQFVMLCNLTCMHAVITVKFHETDNLSSLSGLSMYYQCMQVILHQYDSFMIIETFKVSIFLIVSISYSQATE